MLIQILIFNIYYIYHKNSVIKNVVLHVMYGRLMAVAPTQPRGSNRIMAVFIWIASDNSPRQGGQSTCPGLSLECSAPAVCLCFPLGCAFEKRFCIEKLDRQRRNMA